VQLRSAPAQCRHGDARGFSATGCGH
jgi:hypothetical protein